MTDVEWPHTLSLPVWFFVVVTETVLCLTPGPAVLFVSCRAGACWPRGFALQAANPKALLFFVALLPQFVDVHQAIAPPMAILATTSALVELVILAGYGDFAGRAAALARETRFVTATIRASGGLLIATGTLLALKGNR